MRKAMTSNVVTLILLLAVFIILVVGVTPLYALLKNDSKDETCRLSVIAHSASKVTSPFSKQSSFDIKCARKSLVFYDTYVERDNVKVPVWESDTAKAKSVKYKTLNKYIVNQVIANELYKCWRNMGAGKLDVFNPDFGINANAPCIVCATVKFQVTTNDRYQDLVTYLKMYNVSQEKMTYWDYLNVPQPSNRVIPFINQLIPYGYLLADKDSSLLVPANLDTTSQYIIYFYGYKPPTSSTLTGMAANAYMLLMTEMKDMTGKCQFIYN